MIPASARVMSPGKVGRGGMSFKRKYSIASFPHLLGFILGLEILLACRYLPEKAITFRLARIGSLREPAGKGVGSPHPTRIAPRMNGWTLQW
jgi:hypothetical protein